MFEAIRESIKFKEETAREKGWWAFVRSLLRADLNNAKNAPIQGLAGHILNRGTLDINRKFKSNSLDARVCLTVHDEATAYAKIGSEELAANLFREGMEKNAVTQLLDVAMVADPVICDNLKESK
jgi:DNA polymerase I-like protein with 3'-5' exonuclease and polymerase domains